MRLVRARITNFRSIENSGSVEIDDVACLVGKNESGKTNFLVALSRTNPPPGVSGAFDLTEDFPRRHLNDMEAALKKDDADQPGCIEVTYALSVEQMARLDSLFGKNAVILGQERHLKATKDYAGHKTWKFNSDDAAVVRHLASRFQLVGPVAGASTLAEFRALAEAEDEPSDALTKALAQLDGWKNGFRQEVASWFAWWEPYYVYFSDYERMIGEGNVRELLEMREQREQLTGGERTFLSLLDMANADLDDLKEGSYEPLKARLEGASISLSQQLYDYWRQNQSSEIEVDHDYVAGPAPRTDRDLVLKVRVKDKRHMMSVPVDKRSNGFVWFFSFLINFSRIRDTYPSRPLVLLLDEPGTALHGLAQRDFLRVIDERLTEHQVLYSTHQPFLVDAERLDRARPVVDDPENGTTITNNPYKIDSDTLFPIQAALGYEIGQTLFVAPNVLLVEGTSDLVYLQLASRAVEADGRVGLDRRWTITPVGGVDRMDTFVRLFSANHLNTCVLLDVSGNKKAKVEKLVASGDLRAEQVVRLTEFTKAVASDIEDMFDLSFYVDLVRGVGAENQIAQMGLVTKEALVADDPRVTRKIDALLAPLGLGRLDHMPPALYFERHQKDLLPKLSKRTLDRFEKLFKQVNAQLTL